MAENSAIEWCDSTFNPWMGCTKISPACDHCYAEALMDTRHHRVKWGGARSRTGDSNWQQPRRWQRQAAAFHAEHGRRRRVFCASLADVFDNQVPPEWRNDLWTLIRETPDLDWLLLTKRPQNIAGMLPPFWDDVKGHVWLGTTVEDQKRAIQNIPHLLQHDSAVRFVSCEPLLGPIDLTKAGGIAPPHKPFFSTEAKLCSDPMCERTGPHYPAEFGCRWGKEPRGPAGLDWVIAGGESGSQARPSHPDWFRSLRDQCVAADVPFLFKQWGEWAPENCGVDFAALERAADAYWDGYEFQFDLADQDAAVFQAGDAVYRVGKKHSGRHLDGLEHDGFPVSA